MSEPTAPQHRHLPEPRLTAFRRWLAQHEGRSFDDYDALWRWSVADLPGFWGALWRHADLQSATPWRTVLEDRVMPGARWFPGATLNYAQQVLRHADAAHAAGHPALVFHDERSLSAGGPPREVSWPALRAQVAALAAALRGMGVQPGDRVAAILPNAPQAIVAFLACASVGAVWSVCSPDMGPVAVLDRFRQIAPKLLFAVDGQFHNGRLHDRRAVLAEVLSGLPELRHVVWLPVVPDAGPPGPAAAPSGAPAGSAAGAAAACALHRWDALVAPGGADAEARPAGFEPLPLPFDHPLWIVYSSGTTGLPKAIVHGHGGVVLESLKAGLHNDVGASAERGDRFFWTSSTGWIMWNAQPGALLGGTTVCIYDGSAAPPDPVTGRPDWSALWRFAAATGATFFGAGSAFWAGCMKAGLQPQAVADLSRLRALGATGSPLADEVWDWLWQACPRPDGAPIWIAAISGGTDFAGAFVAGNRELPQRRGVMQCRCLGADVQAWDEAGRPLHDAVGELVCTTPLPSMPLRLWNDPDGRRLHDSYFDMYPGVWRHGDWIRITPEGGAVIYGRSDATLNRHGIRMGTAELYRAVEALPDVLDSLVVDLEFLGRPSWMALFVVLRDGLQMDEPLQARLKDAVRHALSPRHVPDQVFQVPAVPRTLSGKKMELPVKKLLMGADPAQVMNRDAIANAECVDWYLALARERAAAG